MKKYYPTSSKEKKASKAETLIQHRLVAKRYMIKMVIREDEMSVDHLAFDREMDRNVSLKVIPPEVAKDTGAMNALKRETDAALLLADEHIARLYDLETWKDLTYAVYEYVPGSSLSHLMDETDRPLTLEETLPLMKQLALALDYAHRNRPRMVHADLKPSNILLTETGMVRVADFGVAKVFSDTIIRVSAAEDPSTFGYKAPEQIAGKEVSVATDVYAMAAIAYEMLSGRPPFYEGDLRSQILNSEVKKIEEIPEHANQAILCALSKNEADRPKSASDFVAMLAGEKPVPVPKPKEEAVKTEPPPGISQSSPGPGIGAVAPSGKKKPVMLLLAALVIALAAGAGWFFVQKGKAPKTPEEKGGKPVVAVTPKSGEEKALGPQGQGPKGAPAAGSTTKVEEPVQGFKIERPTIGDVVVDSTPQGAEVLLDGKKMGMTPVTLTEIQEGRHALALRKEGFDPWQKQIEIIALKRSEVNAELEMTYGGLEVGSTPEEADVYLDGKKVGVTPLVLSDVKKGMHQIAVKKKEYEDWEQKVKIASGESIKLFAELGEVYGSLNIDSRPGEADVYLDGRNQGKTPLVLERVKEGKQQVEIMKEGFAPWRRAIVIKSGKATEVVAELDAAFGNLKITSKPSEANVLVDGKLQGKTPLILDKLKSGSVKVEVGGLACHESLIREVAVPGGKSAESEFVLKSICGSVSVASEPADAKWYFDDKPQGNTPGIIKNIEKGKHTIKITKADYIDWAGIVEIQPDGTENVKAKLDRVPPKSGDTYRDPITGMMFTWIEGGCFQMGSPATEQGRSTDEGPLHEVCVKGFWMGIYEVTQEEWKKVVGGNPAFFNKGGDYPVENVSWNGVQAFIQRLNQQVEAVAKDSPPFRLPTEAEWEYAARGRGGSQIFAGSNQLNAVAWYKNNSKRTSHPVGKKTPNEKGLYDMSGNLYEWVADVYAEDAYSKHAKNGPVVTTGGPERVCRGGSWFHGEEECRNTARGKFAAETPNTYVGFRLVRGR